MSVVCIFAGAADAAHGQTCQEIARGVAALDPSAGKEVPIRLGSKVTFRAAFTECDKKNTFDGKPVPSGHKCRGDDNQVDRLLMLPDRTLIVTAKAGVDADGSTLSQKRPGTALPQTSFHVQGKSLDAETMPYIVMPGAGSGPHLNVQTGVKLGDLAVVIAGEHCSFALVGDMGSYNRFGEISMAAHDDLGHPQCLRAEKPCTALKGKGGDGESIPRGVTYVIFPDTKFGGLTIENYRDQVRAHAQERIRRFLGDYGVPQQ
ncbi:glycoside hydrolase family 75 protein [Ralstonia flatus]|uniref:glycoside hydrolase family 75 protein n=1 Tax=Ralstonia flatus TaxID=3058601 RepID=UPI00292D8B62|nr:glycoside hydrolase family 75 protein [Ralstonia sp. LMG 32965]